MLLNFFLCGIFFQSFVFVDCSINFQNNNNLGNVSNSEQIRNYFEDDMEDDDESVSDQYYDSFCTTGQTRTVSFDPNDVKFYLYSDPSNVNKKEEIVYGNVKTLKSLTPNKEIKFLVHGFTDNGIEFCNTSPNESISIKDAYLKEKTPNIICVDWAKLAGPGNKVNIAPPFTSLPFYIPVLKNIKKVGKRIAQFVQFLIANKIAESPNSVHILGHSLGAHVAGSAGYNTKKATNIPIGRISGLDPAGPLIMFLKEEDKLGKDDAKFIDVTHSNTDFFGTFETLGIIDFYAFGGRGIDQPDCKNKTYLGVTALNCGHSDAPKYYAASILKDIQGCKCKKTGFQFFQNPQCLVPKGKKCSKPVKYGENVPKAATGNYYIEVNLKADKTLRQNKNR